MASQDTNLPDLKLSPLLGLNERAAKNAIPAGEWETLQGLYPSRAGLLSRMPGKELYAKLDSAIYAIHQTHDGSGAILVQTATDLRRFTLDELLGRAYSPSLTSTTITEEESMSLGILVHKEAAGTDGGSIATSYGQRKLTDIVVNETSFITALGNGSAGVTGAFTLAAGSYRIRVKACAYLVSTSGNVRGFVHKLYNVTAGADAFTGAVYSASASGVFTEVSGSSSAPNLWTESYGTLTIAAPAQFEIRDKASAVRATDGRGRAMSLGESEIYAVVEILKTA